MTGISPKDILEAVGLYTAVFADIGFIVLPVEGFRELFCNDEDG